jgi:hypothetical protein
MSYRTYDPERDKDAVHRIWMETGWLEKGKEETMDTMVSAGRAIVADINGEPECLVITAPGTLRYLTEDLTMCAVTGVTTSRVARKQGFAKRLAAQAIAIDATEGAMVANLGMFEQGYYNQIGFGTIGYEHVLIFDPSAISVHHRARTPRRLTMDDVEIMHAARLARPRRHGAANLLPVAITKADLLWTTNGFGLGYFDGAGGSAEGDNTKGLSHFLWAGCKDVERGPYNIGFMVHRTGEQFLELMALIRNLGDQVLAVKMVEPPHIQVQDLIIQPFKQRAMTQNSPYAAGMRSAAYSQSRICNLPACMEHTHLRGRDSVRFNLTLTDPIAAVLDASSPWRGVGGDYVITLGPASGAEKGHDATLPTLTASVNAFTRLWLGVRPATSLAITDDLAGPASLLEQLDWALLLPEAKLDWEF